MQRGQLLQKLCLPHRFEKQRQSATPVGPAPELSKTISGKSYRLADNDPHVKTFSLNLVYSNPSWGITTATQRLDRPTARFGGSIGLDGLFRKSSARYGIDAVKGAGSTTTLSWWSGEFSGTATSKTLAFDNDKVDVKYESTDGEKVDLHGEADE
jgi:hypothetical protein